MIAPGDAPSELSRSIAGEAEVRWTVEDQRFVHTTTESTKFVHELFKQHGDRIGDLEVRRTSLEDTCMTLVRRHESGEPGAAVHSLAEVAR